jgi:hypothetical protein
MPKKLHLGESSKNATASLTKPSIILCLNSHKNVSSSLTSWEICKYRIHAHSLKIETGRYLSIDRQERICDFCNDSCIEDEFHFILKCKLNSHKSVSSSLTSWEIHISLKPYLHRISLILPAKLKEEFYKGN